MSAEQDGRRRKLLKQCLCATALVPFAGLWADQVRAAQLPLLRTDEPAAKKLNYTESAQTKEKNCGSCALYQGSYGSAQGPCQIFPGKQVKASGWCESWEPQI